MAAPAENVQLGRAEPSRIRNRRFRPTRFYVRGACSVTRLAAHPEFRWFNTLARPE